MEADKNKARPLTVFGSILGGCLVLSAIIGAVTFAQVRSQNLLSVTGSAKQSIESDEVRWVAGFSRTVFVEDIKNGYKLMDSDLVAVKKFYAENGITADQLNISPVFVEQYYGNQNEPRQYILRQTVETNSTDVQKITDLTKSANDLVNRGVFFTTNSLEYYYSKLPELRVSLLTDALKDAKSRADVLAKSAGKKVGTLKSATSGVVQVLSSNSVEVADYGAYDTSTIKKEVMVTVKASFGLK